MDTVKIKVNGFEFEAEKGSTILNAILKKDAPYAEIDVPTLYYLPEVLEMDNSGVNLVEIKGKEGLFPAWNTCVEDGMEIINRSEALTEARRDALRSILNVHDHDCADCTRTGNCELQTLLRDYDVDDVRAREYKVYEIDEDQIIVRDTNKCIRCSRCVTVCESVQGIGAITTEGAGLDAIVKPVSGNKLSATNCVNCGQCIEVCPVGALRERDDTDPVLEAIRDPKKFVIAQVAPSVRTSLGELYEFPIGSEVEKRLASSLRALGFDKVFDTDFGADLTIMEESNEFLERLEQGGKLPMFTSCCPGWVKFLETEYHELIGNLSSCKAPHTMLGAVCKSYYAEKLGLKKEDIVVVSIMPCTAKKFEIAREDECGAGVPDVDFSLTVRETARMLMKAEVPFEAAPPEPFDVPLGIGSGAGVIFGASGGVMEAALRTAVETLTGKPLEKLEFEAVRGTRGLKEASFEVAGKTIKVAAVSGLANTRELMGKIKNKEVEYDFVEVMACPGGCINGGGQPIQSAYKRAKCDIPAVRAELVYANDEAKELRKSHENPAVKELYDTYLDRPGSELAHQLLHTSYIER